MAGTRIIYGRPDVSEAEQTHHHARESSHQFLAMQLQAFGISRALLLLLLLQDDSIS